MVVDPAAELVNNAVVGLTRTVGDVPGADHEVAIGTKAAVDVVEFGAEHEGSLFPDLSAGAVGETRSHRRLAKHEPAQAEISAGGKALVPAIGVLEAGGRRICGRIVESGIEVGLNQGIEPINVDLTSATLDRGYNLGIQCIRQYGSRHENCQS